MGHVAHDFRDRGRLARRRRTDRPADAPQRRLDRLSVGRRFVTGEFVGIFDRAAAPADCRGLQAGFGFAGEIGRHGLRRGRERGDAAVRAPCPERGEVGPVGRARGRGLVLPREVGCAVDIGGRECGQLFGARTCDDERVHGVFHREFYVRESSEVKNPPRGREGLPKLAAIARAVVGGGAVAELARAGALPRVLA
jgi:hypothetical protein